MANKFKFVALWLSAIIILFFILQVIIPGFTEAFILNSEFAFNEPWRFLSSIFLHGSVLHLVYNLFALVLFGLILEKFIGSKNFLIVFFASGIFASLLAGFFYDNSLGASGAIFGVIGALTIIKPLMTVWAFSLPMPLFVAAILWLVGDLIGIFVPSNIANIAHLAGLGIGLIFGIIFRLRKKQNSEASLMLKQPAYNANLPSERQIYAWENSYLRKL